MTELSSLDSIPSDNDGTFSTSDTQNSLDGSQAFAGQTAWMQALADAGVLKGNTSDVGLDDVSNATPGSMALADAGPSSSGCTAEPDHLAPAVKDANQSVLHRVGNFLTNPHTALGAASFAPSVLGSAASAVDGILYAAEGDRTNAAISLGAAAVGMVSDAGVARLAAKGVKAGAEMVQAAHAGEAMAHVTQAEHAVETGGTAAHAVEGATGAEKTAQGAGKVEEAGAVAKTETQLIALSRSRFGHAFERHGQDATDFLTHRAKAMGQPNGQFLDNQAAARFIQENLDKAKSGPVSLPIPEGFPARIINPDGSFSPARTIRLVPGGKGVKTAFPEL